MNECEPRKAWGVMWRSNSKLYGRSRYLMGDWGTMLPRLFKSKREAADWIKTNYPGFADDKNLRAQPHGWRVPIPVRVTVAVEAKE